MHDAFEISRRLEEGSVIHVATVTSLERAEELVGRLMEFWPGVYEIEAISEAAHSSS